MQYPHENLSGGSLSAFGTSRSGIM
ncbi:hypothetical protein THICB2_30262 [Thiomonas sp. CB2]|nr:hypothetical protein THICB2_30262 [Thiomonas sp. CB2]